MSTDYKLSKWSRLIRVRDRGICQLCAGQFNIWRLHAHHIYPRSLYPERDIELSNGVTLCMPCHIGIVHRNNSFIDTLPDHEAPGWRHFQPMFTRYTSLATQRHFNELNQNIL